MRTHKPLTQKRWLGALAALLFLTVLSTLLGMSFGSARSMTQVWTGLCTGTLDEQTKAILWMARLPRVAFGAIVGAALGMSGVAFQAVLRNPLADPYILGVSGGSALGATLFLSYHTSYASYASHSSDMFTSSALLGVPIASLIGAVCTLSLLLAVMRFAPKGRTGIWVLLLTGVLFNAFASSMITFIKTIVTAQKAQELLFFLMGTLAVEHTDVWTFSFCALTIALCAIGLMAHARDLDIMTLGDDEAYALGVHAGRVRRRVVVWASAAVAVSVSFTGLIGFVGLVVPHGIRLICGADHRLVLPASMLGGASFVVLSDTIARRSFEFFATTLPVGVITSLLGAPLFALLMFKTMRRNQVHLQDGL